MPPSKEWDHSLATLTNFEYRIYIMSICLAKMAKVNLHFSEGLLVNLGELIFRSKKLRFFELVVQATATVNNA